MLRSEMMRLKLALLLWLALAVLISANGFVGTLVLAARRSARRSRRIQ